MKKKFAIALILSILPLNAVTGFDLNELKPVDPLDGNNSFYQEAVNQPSYTLKRGTLTRNAIKNQYTIAMDKFIQSNVRASYQDFKILIDNVVPNDYVYMKLTQDMASIGFFSLAELSMSKIQDDDISHLLEEDVKNYYFPNYRLTSKDQMYLAEMYSNIMYNDQSQEATKELLKQNSLLADSDYANYLVAFGCMKNGDIKQAQKSIDIAMDKNPKNINYKRLKAEISSQSDKPQSAIKLLKNLDSSEVNTTIFDNELYSSEQYIRYKAEKNEYRKKYYLANYYYTEKEYNKAIRVLQTAISGKKDVNKDVYALTSKVYFDTKEFEKAQEYALKAIDIDSSNSSALIVLGDVSSRNGNFNAAENYYKRAISKDTNHTAELRLAQNYQKLNNIKKAKEIYSKVLKVSSKAYLAYYNMALLEKDREETYLKKSVALNPDFKDGWIDLARLELAKEDIEQALMYLGIAKYIDENDYRYYYYLGLVLKQKGMLTEAKKDFEKCINLNPEYQPAKEELNI